MVSFLLTSCGSLKDISLITGNEKSKCYKQDEYNYSVNEISKPIHELKIDTLLSNHFSFEALNVANAIGLIEPLHQFVVLKLDFKANPSLQKQVELLELRQNITDRINLSSLEISSVSSELDCEEERANQLAGYLKSKADQREKNLVIASIVVGAAGGIGAEILGNSTSGNSGSFVAIGASIAETVFGVLMLTNQKKISYDHKRNTIGEIWNVPTVSKTLPPGIWYYLNYKNRGIDKFKQSLREFLVANWLAYGEIENPKERTVSPVYFGSGGIYSSDELQIRANMYDQIESYIKLMKQDLTTLFMELENLNAEE